MKASDAVALDTSGPKRPLAVWLIFLFYVVATGFTVLSFALIYMGRIPLNEAQKIYFANLSIFDHITTVALGTVNVTAAILLFRLRRTAIPLMVGALVLNLALGIRAMFASNWIEALSPAGLVGASLGWLTALAVLLYTIRLKRRGTLS